MKTSPTQPGADVALILEGTYPYVAGGVSTWVHQILAAYPDRRFALLHIGPHPGAYEKPRYTIPSNVSTLAEVHCRGAVPTGPQKPGRRIDAPRVARNKAPSRMLRAIRRMHVDDVVDDEMLTDLASGDLSMNEFLHGDATFELLRNELYERVSPQGPFMDFFWHFRAMHIPLLRLLAAPCPDAGIYHAVSTGYAGLIGAVQSVRTGRPLVVTEHGLYAREREMELSRARWIKDIDNEHGGRAPRPSPLRRFWSHYFRMLSRIAYHRASKLVTLSEANRAKQLADGASAHKIMVVPNGVARAGAPAEPPPEPRECAPVPATGKPTLRVGFVGRVVPIKDVITLIRAVGIARNHVDLDVQIVGPQDEDPSYAKRCFALVDSLNLGETIKFLGPKNVSEMYPTFDVVLLTSLSEGQPLVMLEAYAHGVPVIATDVGACRELVEGGDTDRALGPSGIVTRVANPPATAAALIALARDPALRANMGRAALARVNARYQLHQVVASYENLYSSVAA
ncbi:MAG TPA: GT4 family glycosyltransferase PelF [Kofleriaceae bacterium]|nr:GT4 family glycosyltransferase PelF [Kofleriaceae bacterium]